MKIFLLLGGTTEGRKILESGLPVIYSAATAYGAESVNYAHVRVGPMDAGEMERFIREKGILGVIDATHPHALEVSRNARLACERALTPYARVVREFVKIHDSGVTDTGVPDACVTVVGSCKEAAELLNEPGLRGARALLTVGSKELGCFTAVEDYRNRLFPRILPVEEALRSCWAAGFDAGHIIAMQGPFSRAMNAATLKMTDARVLVTKDSGAAGGLEAKLAAARECGVPVVLIQRPGESGMTVDEAVEWGRRLLRDAWGVPLFPFFVNMAGRKVLVVGGGPVALRRARTLLLCGAAVTVVSPEFHPDFAALAQGRDKGCDKGFDGNLGFGPNLRLIRRRWEERDFDGIFTAVLATDDRELNRSMGERARKAGIPVSVADASEECSFFFPSLVAEGEVSAAVSAGGCPALTRRLAARLRTVWRDWVGEAREAGKIHETCDIHGKMEK
ncbi:MAG: precorrin-6A reductase [Synergistaceae bacterium]|jgi:precorrin-2 dehydrogenase/sirohydrochlorin ferrochelatase/precorrin-6A/cobalt-precorrin-6A reductase|nr:precorrin-6A reductase [Synergistaceae bacterium]